MIDRLRLNEIDHFLLRMNIELAVDALHMALHRSARQAQIFSDTIDGVPARHEKRNVRLARRKGESVFQPSAQRLVDPLCPRLSRGIRQYGEGRFRFADYEGS